MPLLNEVRVGHTNIMTKALWAEIQAETVEDVTPFVYAHHVVCALESADGSIYTGFCIEACSGVMNLCAERAAALNMYMNSGQTKLSGLSLFGIKHRREAAAVCPAALAVSFCIS